MIITQVILGGGHSTMNGAIMRYTFYAIIIWTLIYVITNM